MAETDHLPQLEGHPNSARPRRRIAGDSIFFPLATVYAIFVLPASVFAMLGLTDALPALASATGHAHEMLFGFALAVVAGNQLGPVAMPRLALLAGLWVIARAAFLCAPQNIMAAAANIAFAALLAAQLAPRLLGTAKKWRNQALPLVLVAICISSVAFQLTRHAGFAGTEHTVPIVAVLLLALLMLFMGGRIIAPTVAGQFYRQGGKLDARVQPRIEGGQIIAMAVAIAASLCANWPPFAMLAAGDDRRRSARDGAPAALAAVGAARQTRPVVPRSRLRLACHRFVAVRCRARRGPLPDRCAAHHNGGRPGHAHAQRDGHDVDAQGAPGSVACPRAGRGDDPGWCGSVGAGAGGAGGV